MLATCITNAVICTVLSVRANASNVRNKGSGMYYPVCKMVHTKKPLWLNEKSNPQSGDLGI